MTNHSGGANGSDIAWEMLGKEYGVKTIAYSFYGHNCLSKNCKILTNEELGEGWYKVIISADKLKRYIGKSSPYVKKLLCRNWFQVKNADCIFAIGMIVQPNEMGSKYKNKSKFPVVDGGTGYAVSMAIEEKKPVFVFDQNKNKWFKWDKDNFIETEEPILTNNFAGIGTRNLNKDGINAIKSIYKKTFNELKKID